MDKKNLILFPSIILTLVLAGVGCNSSTKPKTIAVTKESQPQIGTQVQIQTTPQAPTQPKPVIYESKVREFTITAKDWKFSPNTIIVNQGDKVILKITSADVAHSFLLKDYGIDKKLEPNKTQTIEFIADKFGVFPFRCGVPCGEGHKEMVGTFVVK